MWSDVLVYPAHIQYVLNVPYVKLNEYGPYILQPWETLWPFTLPIQISSIVSSVYIIIMQTPIGHHWTYSLKHIYTTSLLASLQHKNSTNDSGWVTWLNVSLFLLFWGCPVPLVTQNVMCQTKDTIQVAAADKRWRTTTVPQSPRATTTRPWLFLWWNTIQWQRSGENVTYFCFPLILHAI